MKKREEGASAAAGGRSIGRSSLAIIHTLQIASAVANE